MTTPVIAPDPNAPLAPMPLPPLPTPTDDSAAREFFRQLTGFSAQYLASLRLPPMSPWGYEGYEGDKAPRGAILHYTANSSLGVTLSWFCHEVFAAKASSHVVIGSRREPNAEQFLAQWPLIKALPVTVVQTRPALKGAWHATWVNAFTYGIENVNMGELRRVNGKLMSWPPATPGGEEWTTEWANPENKSPLDQVGRTWDNYSSGQVWANIAVLRYANALFGGSLQPEWILGHEQVQGKKTPHCTSEKRDPGPLFPLHDIRAAVMGQEDPAFLDSYDAQPTYESTKRDARVIATVKALSGNDMSAADAWAAFKAAMVLLPSQTGNSLVLKRALNLLGYFVDIDNAAMGPVDTVSVKTFQVLMGLTEDGVPGPITRRAMLDRLVDRGYLSAP